MMRLNLQEMKCIHEQISAMHNLPYIKLLSYLSTNLYAVIDWQHVTNSTQIYCCFSSDVTKRKRCSLKNQFGVLYIKIK
jgi:hypothetical protein